jgi:site-specific recombinase XerD
MLRSGVSLVHAQRILGHADPRTTSKVYVHMNVEDLRAAVESMGAVPKPRKEAAR